MPSRVESAHKDNTKPPLQSILQTEIAAPFSKKPSGAYRIEYTSNIYNPEAINSMATSSSNAATFIPTMPTLRPTSMKTTIKTNTVQSSSTLVKTTSEQEKQKLHVQQKIHAGWPIYNLIIEGHSKVKTYGLKNDDAVGNSLPMIRLVQPKKNPIVKHVTNPEGPEFKVKHLQSNKKTLNEFFSKNSREDKKSAITSLLSLLDSSFGNFLSDAATNMVHNENENKIVKNEK